MTIKLKFVAPLLVLAAGIGTVVALDAAKPVPQKSDPEIREISLYVDNVRSETLNLSVRTQGEVKAKTEIAIMPQVSGRIVSISEQFAEGAAFTPDTVLIKIEDADYQLAVTSAEARVAQATVTLEKEMADASIKRKQWKDWVKDGTPTPLALNAPQVAEAQAQLRAAEADLKTAKLNLERTNIRVPYNGRVLKRSVGVGQIVGTGTELGKVFATDTVEVRLPLTDAQLAEVNLPLGFIAEEGNAPEVTFTHSAGGKSFSWAGHIARVNAAIDRDTRLVYAIAEVKDPYGAAADQGRPFAVGLFVHATIRSVNPTHTLAIPRDALRSENRVYVIKDGKLDIRSVDVLSTTADMAYVASGVDVGEKVVISPVRGPYAGMPVVAITRTAATPDSIRH